MRLALAILALAWLGATTSPTAWAAPQAGPSPAASAAGTPATTTSPAAASPTAAPGAGVGDVLKMLPDVQSPAGATSAVNWILLVTLLSVAPAVLILVTCFTRIIVVLGLLRQALATQQLPPNQVLFGLALLMTIVIMTPVYRSIDRDAIQPYTSGKLSTAAAVEAASSHLRGFMILQIDAGGNGDDVYLFLGKELAEKKDLTWADVPTPSLIAAFVVSELKIAFTIGFRIFLPFLIIDMLVASVLISSGMLMLPPVLVSLPFKLLLFVLADGWNKVVGTLMQSFS